LTIGEMFGLPGFKLPYLVELVRAVGNDRGYTFGKERDPDKPESPTEELATPATLEEELALLVSCRPKRGHGENLNRNLLIAMRFFGFDGLGGATLRELGETFGLTRERVRQICDRIPKVYKRYKVPTPLLKKCIELIAAEVPREAEEVEDKLHSEG